MAGEVRGAVSSSSDTFLRRRLPFAAWPTQYSLPEGSGRLWFVPDATICMQLTTARGDLRMAKDYVASIRALRALHHASIAQAGGLRLVQDFRSLSSVEKEARAYLDHAARRDFHPDDLVFNKVAIREDLVLVRIAFFLHTVAGARFGLPRVESVSDLEAEVERLGLAPPPLGADHAEWVERFEAKVASMRDP